MVLRLVYNIISAHVQSAMGLLHLIEDFDPKHIGAIWDAAHSGLAGRSGDRPDIVWSHLHGG